MATGFLPDTSRAQRGRPHWAWWIAAVLGLVALVGWAPTARLAASHLPTKPGEPGGTVLAVERSGGSRATHAFGSGGLRLLPAGLPPSVRISTAAQVAPYARAALGSRGAAELLVFLQPDAKDVTSSAGTSTPGNELNPTYPYRYSALEPILDAAPAAAFSRHALALGAALTLLAAQPNPKGETNISNAAPAAYAVLDRARTATGCDGQLDLLLLLAGDGSTASGVLAGEERRAEAACPHDPTAAGVRLIRPFADRSPHPGAALEVLIDAEETAHDFAAAAQTGRRLVELGSGAYPPVAALYPESGDGDAGATDDAALPLSTGAPSLAPLSDALKQAGGAGGGVQDLSFIPRYRDDLGVTGIDTACPAWSWRRDELLSGHPGAALQAWPATFYGVRPGYAFPCSPGNLKLVAELAANRKLDRTEITHDQLMDEWQNVLRWAGNLTAARSVAMAWDTADGDTVAGTGSALQLGEVDFLQHRYEAAAAEFQVAEQRVFLGSPPDTVGLAQATVDRGAALFAAGRTAEADELLAMVPDSIANDYDYDKARSDTDLTDLFASLAYATSEQLGDAKRLAGDLHGAVEDYNAALRWLPLLSTLDGIRPEAVYNNEALAYLGLHDTRDAAALEAKALAIDPDDPVFLMGAGFIAERAGRTAEAIRDNRAALQSDPGAFPAANDLGVELATTRHAASAVTPLREAVGADPAYALGWFNLGVLEARMGPLHLLASQGALARAYALEPKLKVRKKDLTIDGSIYRTALDLSKPLPPGWSLAQTQRPAPAAAAGVLAVLLLAIGLGRAARPGNSDTVAKVLEPLNARLEKVGALRPLAWAGWALAATVATFVLAYWRHATSVTEGAAYAVGIVALTGTAMAARSVIASRLAVTARQRSWTPGMLVGLVTGAIGVPWAPLPYLETRGPGRVGLHQTAPIALAVTSAILFVESAWSNVPLTQSLAVAALIMTASTLLPIAPLDGARIGKAGMVATAGVIGGAVLIGLGIL